MRPKTTSDHRGKERCKEGTLQPWRTTEFKHHPADDAALSPVSSTSGGGRDGRMQSSLQRWTLYFTQPGVGPAPAAPGHNHTSSPASVQVPRFIRGGVRQKPHISERAEVSAAFEPRAPL